MSRVPIYHISVVGNRDNRYGVDRSETYSISFFREMDSRAEAEEWVRGENFRCLPGDMQCSRLVNAKGESLLLTPDRCLPDKTNEPILYPYLRYFVGAPPDVAFLMSRLRADGVRVLDER